MNYGNLINLLALFLGVLILGILAIVVFLDFWAKYATKGKIMALFIDQRSFYGMLLKVEDNKVHVGKAENREDYLLDPTKQFWSIWPGGFLPRVLSTVVRAHLYVRGIAEPIDPINAASSITSKTLRIISDEAMLKQTWKDVRESLGVAGGSKSLAGFILMACVANIGLSALLMILLMGLNKKFGG